MAQRMLVSICFVWYFCGFRKQSSSMGVMRAIISSSENIIMFYSFSIYKISTINKLKSARLNKTTKMVCENRVIHGASGKKDPIKRIVFIGDGGKFLLQLEACGCCTIIGNDKFIDECAAILVNGFPAAMLRAEISTIIKLMLQEIKPLIADYVGNYSAIHDKIRAAILQIS